MNTNMKKTILSAALVLGLCGLLSAQGGTADPAGTWKCEYSIGDRVRVVLDRVDALERKLTCAIVEQEWRAGKKRPLPQSGQLFSILPHSSRLQVRKFL